MVVGNVRLERYMAHRTLVYRIAHTLARRFDLPSEDMIDEGLFYLAGLTFQEGMFDATRGEAKVGGASRWDGRSSISSWIYQNVYWSLWIYATKRKKRREVSMEEDFDRASRGPSWVEKLMAEVGEEGRALLSVLFEAPGELSGVLWTDAKAGPRPRRCGRKGREAVTRHLLREGWDEARVARAWSEVELYFVASA